jgi:hypothetical protein
MPVPRLRPAVEVSGSMRPPSPKNSPKRRLPEKAMPVPRLRPAVEVSGSRRPPSPKNSPKRRLPEKAMPAVAVAVSKYPLPVKVKLCAPMTRSDQWQPVGAPPPASGRVTQVSLGFAFPVHPVRSPPLASKQVPSCSPFPSDLDEAPPLEHAASQQVPRPPPAEFGSFASKPKKCLATMAIELYELLVGIRQPGIFIPPPRGIIMPPPLGRYIPSAPGIMIPPSLARFIPRPTAMVPMPLVPLPPSGPPPRHLLLAEQERQERVPMPPSGSPPWHILLAEQERQEREQEDQQGHEQGQEATGIPGGNRLSVDRNPASPISRAHTGVKRKMVYA